MTEKELAEYLVRYDNLRSKHIIRAFEEVDRAHFVPEFLVDQAYIDVPLPIGYGQTISQPSTIAFMLEELQPKPGQCILEVGTGSGYVTTMLANIVGPKGKVYGVEIIPELVKIGSQNLSEYKMNWASILRAKSMGLPDKAPFDRIIVSASAEKMPSTLVDQLKPNGKLIIPVGQVIILVEKHDDRIELTEYPGFVFVPLKPVDYIS